MILFLLACTAKEPLYVVATPEKLVGPFENRLSQEDSPYLQQHADNPVDWYPWGEEAFAEARQGDVPIFLSIGYAACHWCHVMAHESFEDPQTALYMNQNFVSIKVDREERPDVDAVYMEAIHLMTGAGGWPASIWLDHELKPFYAGTYFPKDAQYGRPSFRMVLESLTQAWQQDRPNLLSNADALHQELQRRAAPAPGKAPTGDVALEARKSLEARWDSTWAGWGQDNKFPMTARLELLVSLAQQRQDMPAQRMLVEQLDAMDRGGLHDHLGGGFHRYTVDVAWTVPHFEKMLYDNAQLLRVYAQAHLLTGDRRYADVARATADYLVRDMQDPGGGFWSSEDADSGGEEGTFYVWTPEEVRSLLPPDQAEAFLAAYMRGSPNFEGSSWVLNRRKEVDPADPLLVEARLRLFGQRLERVPPPTDDKAVVAWNGLAIGGLAVAGRLLGEAIYVDAARRSAEAVLKRQTPEGELPRTLAAQAPDGTLEDYAFFSLGLLDLYEADPDPRWLNAAENTAAAMMRLFFDEELGGFYQAPPTATELLVRRKDPTDGAEPSGWGRAVQVLLRLRSYGSTVASSGQVDLALAAGNIYLDRAPAGAVSLVQAHDLLGLPSREVVIAVDSFSDPQLPLWLAAYNTAVRPDTVLAVVTPEALGDLESFAALKAKLPAPSGPRAYVCEQGVCGLPADDLPRFIDQLESALGISEP